MSAYLSSMVQSVNLDPVKRLPRAALGFAIQGFSHVFTPLLPLASVYRDRRIPVRGAFASASSLAVELFVRNYGDRNASFLRVVCRECSCFSLCG
jgi:hypothetical protein